MIKSISKISLILFVTFLAGLVMTDCVLPEVPSEERAEIEIEEESEIEIIDLVQAELQSFYFDGGNDNEETISLNHDIVLENKEPKTYNYIENNKVCSNYVIVPINSVPKYILFGSLKLFS